MRELTIAAVFLAVAAPAYGQSVEDLQRSISERDALILELREKIRALETEREGNPRPGPGAVPPPASKGRAVDAMGPDPEELERALERTLVQQGGLVLRPGTFELQPEISYAHWEKSRGLLRHEAGAALSFRAGLPGESQLTVRVPYLHVAAAGGSETAFGDVSVSASKQVAQESGPWPGLLASLSWSARTGKDGLTGGVPTGSGFNQWSGGLTAVKRHDPLMFYGGLSYTAALSREISGVRVAPGDAVGLRFGGILAASPQTAVNVGLNLGYLSVTKADGQPIPGSDTVLGTLQIGVGTVLTRNTLLNLSADVRVAGNVPNFRLTATLPIRF